MRRTQNNGSKTRFVKEKKQKVEVSEKTKKAKTKKNKQDRNKDRQRLLDAKFHLGMQYHF